MQVWANYGREEIAGCWPLSITRYSMTLRQRIRNLYFWIHRIGICKY